jgi:hypothetical protein
MISIARVRIPLMLSLSRYGCNNRQGCLILGAPKLIVALYGIRAMNYKHFQDPLWLEKRYSEKIEEFQALLISLQAISDSFFEW